jgi:16S rRNA (guanine527-N7)-methyltransferase
LSFQDELRRALRGASNPEELTDSQIARLELLDECIERWSKRLDLVGFHSRDERIRRYFAEPLAAAEWLAPAGSSGEALDVGSGGGSPALPLAVARPSWRWTLVESRRKKCVFLEEAARTLGLDTVRVVSERIERLEGQGPVDAVTVRGVRMTKALLARASSWLRPGGRLLWFSGLERLEAGLLELRSLPLVRTHGPLPLLAGERSALLVLERQTGDPPREECFT